MVSSLVSSHFFFFLSVIPSIRFHSFASLFAYHIFFVLFCFLCLFSAFLLFNFFVSFYFSASCLFCDVFWSPSFALSVFPPLPCLLMVHFFVSISIPCSRHPRLTKTTHLPWATSGHGLTFIWLRSRGHGVFGSGGNRHTDPFSSSFSPFPSFLLYLSFTLPCSFSPLPLFLFLAPSPSISVLLLLLTPLQFPFVSHFSILIPFLFRPLVPLPLTFLLRTPFSPSYPLSFIFRLSFSFLSKFLFLLSLSLLAFFVSPFPLPACHLVSVVLAYLFPSPPLPL